MDTSFEPPPREVFFLGTNNEADAAACTGNDRSRHSPGNVVPGDVIETGLQKREIGRVQPISVLVGLVSQSCITTRVQA